MWDLPQKAVAGPTAEQAAKIAEATYNEFLEEPERSKQIGNIPKLLDKFEGNYGTMVKGLQKKYGKASPKKKAEKLATTMHGSSGCMKAPRTP